MTRAAAETRREAHAQLQLANQQAAGRRFKYLMQQSGLGDFFRDGFFERPVDEPSLAVQPARVGDKRRQNSIDEKIVDEEDTVTFLTKQPSLIQGEMRPYQLAGLNWMIRLRSNGLNGILADEMGLGKTLQSIAMLGYLEESCNVKGPHLVLVPMTTLSNWINEFKRWLPSLKILKLHAKTRDARNTLVTQYFSGKRTWDVCLTTYEVANLEQNALKKVPWRFLIIDEAHRIKNEHAQLSKTVRAFKTENRLLITGTPLQNNLHELWALLNFLLPDVFASAERFDELFDLQSKEHGASKTHKLVEQLHRLLRPFMIRRLKADVEKDLPAKTETILFTSLAPVQRDVYKQCLLREISTVQGTSAQKARGPLLNLVMQLRKCCNHPYLFPHVEDRTLPALGEHLIDSCGKLKLLDKLLARLKQRGHRVLVFSQMTRMLDVLEDFLVMRGHRYCRVDGKTPHELREERIEQYNAPKSPLYCFLLSTRAGGLGINLQTADTVVLYDSDWNPQADLQAMDRCHRIGQTKPVHVYRLVTESSVEEKVVERAQQKLKLDAVVVQQGRLQEAKKKLQTADLLKAVRFGADKVFRTTTEELKDEDIDAIIQRGRKRTEDIDKRLAGASKGDVLDFKLDGGMSSNQWEGTDYSSKPVTPFLLDTGKRERRTTYKTDIYATHDEVGELLGEPKKRSYTKSSKEVEYDDSDMPDHLKMPPLHDFQMYPGRERLRQIRDVERTRFAALTDTPAKKAALLKDDDALYSLTLLDEDDSAEKERLLSEGFGEWHRSHFQLFVRGVSRHGRDDLERVAEDLVTKSEGEVRRFAERFWNEGHEYFSPEEWGRLQKQIERGERKRKEMVGLLEAAKKFIGLFSETPERLDFQFNQPGVAGLPPTTCTRTDEERILLELVCEHGYGEWRKIRSEFRSRPEFQFDWFLKSLDPEQIGKRCEVLIRSAERELAELQRRHDAYIDAAKSLAAARKGAPRGDDGKPLSQPQRVAQMFEQMVEDTEKQDALKETLKAQRADEKKKKKRASPTASQAKKRAKVETVVVSVPPPPPPKIIVVPTAPGPAWAPVGAPVDAPAGRAAAPARASAVPARSPAPAPPPPPAPPPAIPANAGPPPKPPRTALRCYMRNHVREQRRARPGASEAQLKTVLTGMWAEAPESERKEMTRRSELDQVRYDREAAEFRSRGGVLPAQGASP